MKILALSEGNVERLRGAVTLHRRSNEASPGTLAARLQLRISLDISNKGTVF